MLGKQRNTFSRTILSILGWGELWWDISLAEFKGFTPELEEEANLKSGAGFTADT